MKLIMKKWSLCSIVVLAMSFLGTKEAAAQEWDHDYVPFVEEGKVWNCTTVGPGNYSNKAIECVFTIQGDTLIDGLSYKKVLCEYPKYYGDSVQHYYCAVREEAYKVFYVESDSLTEELLYDFSSPKETLIMSYGDYKFARTRGWNPEGRPTKQYEFDICAIIDGEVNPSYGFGRWIEGVGSTNNPFIFIMESYISDVSPKVIVLSCVIDGKYLFKMNWMAEPTTVDSKTVKRLSVVRNIFDIQGRRLSAEPKHGVYIRKGKKVVK